MTVVPASPCAVRHSREIFPLFPAGNNAGSSCTSHVMHVVSWCHRHGRAALVAGILTIGAVAAPPLAAQYPVAPSPVLDVSRIGPGVTLSGYFAARQTRRHDSTTFSISRIRLTAEARPMPFLAVRVQGGIRSEEHTSELQSHVKLVRRLPLEKQKP